MEELLKTFFIKVAQNFIVVTEIPHSKYFV